MNTKTSPPAMMVDFEKLEREISTPAPPPVDFVHKKARSAVQIIAHGITQLRWKDAEEMGTAIKAKFPNGTLADGYSLTAAIQAWAEEWESFK